MHRQLTQNKFATLEDTQIIMRGTAIRENQQTEINKSKAMSEKDYQELKSFGTPIATPSEVSKVKVASGQLIPVRAKKN